MKYIYLLFILFCSSVIPAQTKYLIYFNDKGNSQEALLMKNSPESKEALSNLSMHAIERRMKVMPNNKIIDFDDIPISNSYITKIENLGIKIIHKLNWFNAVSAYLNDEQLRSISELPFVKNIEKVKTIKFNKPENADVNFEFNKANDSFQSLNYGGAYTQLALSDITKVHDLGITGGGIIIGVLDTGFELYHNAFKFLNVIAQHDFIFNDGNTGNENTDAADQSEHGTYVLSILAGYDPGSLIGASFNSQVVLAKTENVRSETHAEEDNYAAALEWMENIGVDITTSSVGYNYFDYGEDYPYSAMDGKTTIVTKAVEKAFSKGIVTVTSAGNEGNNSWGKIIAPADAFNIITVGSVNSSNVIAETSSRGPTFDGRIKPEVCAMGVSVSGASIYSGGYFRLNGTSAAAPIAAGAAGLLLSKFPYLKNSQVRKIFLESGDQAANPDNVKGWGLLSALKAVTFPNLEYSDKKYTLHKLFYDTLGIKSGSPEVTFISAGNEAKQIMNLENGNEYTYQLSGYEWNDSIKFYFEYEDNLGNKKRIPDKDYFAFSYGNLNISLNTVYEPARKPDAKYYLYQNYPNPFLISENKTAIEFYSDDNVHAELSIYNILGQQIRTIFKGMSDKGINLFAWNGKDVFNSVAASGVYIAVLNINNEILTRKILLIK